MIRTRIVEVFADPTFGRIQERDLGWCLMPEVPIEKKQPPAPMPGKPGPPPFALKVNEVNYFVVGHSWDVTTAATLVEAKALDAVLVLIVQKVPVAPSGLVTAPANAMDQVKALVPEPGKQRTN